MANVNAEIKWQGNDDTWFTANASEVFEANIQIFHIDGRYKFTDGVTDLSALSFRGSGSGSSYTLTAAEIGIVINAAASATPNDTDLVISVESSVAKKNTWTQIKTFLKTYFDTIYTTTAAVASQITTALSGYVNTSGLTTNRLPKANGTGSVVDSQIFDNGTNVGVGTATPIQKLVVQTNTNGDGFILQRGTNAYLVGFQNDALSGGYLGLYDGATTAKLLINAASFWTCDYINTGRNLAIGATSALPTAKLDVYGGYIRSDVLTASKIVEADAAKQLVSSLYAVSDLKLKPIVQSSSFTALLNATYHAVATLTVTDPTPVEGQGFEVLVLDGTATVGGVAYSIAGTIIKRIFHSGSWSNYIYGQ